VLRLQTAEFMGSDPLMAALGLRIALIAYPVVALSKVSSGCVRLYALDVRCRLLCMLEAHCIYSVGCNDPLFQELMLTAH
jgi:hypothetical protein